MKTGMRRASAMALAVLLAVTPAASVYAGEASASGEAALQSVEENGGKSALPEKKEIAAPAGREEEQAAESLTGQPAPDAAGAPDTDGAPEYREVSGGAEAEQKEVPGGEALESEAGSGETVPEEKETSGDVCLESDEAPGEESPKQSKTPDGGSLEQSKVSGEEMSEQGEPLDEESLEKGKTSDEESPEQSKAPGEDNIEQSKAPGEEGFGQGKASDETNSKQCETLDEENSEQGEASDEESPEKGEALNKVSQEQLGASDEASVKEQVMSDEASAEDQIVSDEISAEKRRVSAEASAENQIEFDETSAEKRETSAGSSAEEQTEKDRMFAKLSREPFGKLLPVREAFIGPVSEQAADFNAIISGQSEAADGLLSRALPAPVMLRDERMLKEAGSGEEEYVLDAVCSFAMFKIAKTTATVKGEQVSIALDTSSDSYDAICLGSSGEVDTAPVILGTANDLGGYTFRFELPAASLGTDVTITPRSHKKGEWYTKKPVTLTLPAIAEKPEEKPEETPGETPSEPPVPDASDDASAPSGDLADGSYKPQVETGEKMFRVVDCMLVRKDGAMEAVITLSGTGYDYLYPGTGAEAEQAGASAWIPFAADAEGKYTYTVPVPALDTPVAVAAHSIKQDKWYDRTLTFRSEGMKAVAPDGMSKVEVESSASMFRVTGCTITSRNGVMEAVITLSGTGYDYLYPGTGEEAGKADPSAWIPFVKNDAGEYTYTVPVSELNVPIAVAAHSIRQDKWYDRTLTFKSAGLRLVAPDGTYTAEAASDSRMFKVVDCVLTSVGGEMRASITLSGSGYDRLFPGTAEEAAAADASAWISCTSDAEGRAVFVIPVSALDQPIAVAAYAVKSQKWLDRTLTFSSKGLTRKEENGGSGEDSEAGVPTPAPTAAPTPTPTPVPDTSPDEESRYESDLGGGTSHVDSSTGLADGVYTPDRFSWSGGTGRVGISCSKVTVEGGQAYATLVFGSSSYSYVKASGNTYYGSHSGDTTTFVIPVQLNRNNRILGMTTAMSAAHEIEYSIFIYIEGAEKKSEETTGGAALEDNTALDDAAPEILGLAYEGETKLDHAEYFRLYHYEQGITLLEIDRMSGTASEGEEAEESFAKAGGEETMDAAPAEEGAEEGEQGQAISDAEKAVAVYQGRIVKYLLVPEQAEIPVGLDEDVIVVRLPLTHVYAASEEIAAILRELGALDALAAVGVKQEDCGLEELSEAMEEERVVYGGTFEDLDLRAIVKQKCDFAILPAELLPHGDPGESEEAGQKDGENPESAEETEKKEALYAELSEQFAMLGIPMIVDRSADEKTELAQREWIRVYGALLGCEEESDALFERAVQEAE